MHQLVWIVSLWLCACGFIMPQYRRHPGPGNAEVQPTAAPNPGSGTNNDQIPETEASPSPVPAQGDVGADCKAAALVSFKANVAPATDACAACHASIARVKLTRGAVDANHEVLKGVAALDQIIYSSTRHPGGDQSSNLPKTKLLAWLSAESLCQ